MQPRISTDLPSVMTAADSQMTTSFFMLRPENATYMQLVCRIDQKQAIIQGLKRFSTPLPKLERNHLFIRHFSLERAII